jgi:hypothetical protein
MEHPVPCLKQSSFWKERNWKHVAAGASFERKTSFPVSTIYYRCEHEKKKVGELRRNISVNID